MLGGLLGAALSATEGVPSAGTPSIWTFFLGPDAPPIFLSLMAFSLAALIPAALRSSMLIVRLGARGRGCFGAKSVASVVAPSAGAFAPDVADGGVWEEGDAVAAAGCGGTR